MACGEWRFPVAFAGLCCVPTALSAQAVELRLRDESSRAPLSGAIVRLLDQTGPVSQGLTNEVGRIVLLAPRAGSYRLRIDRIGFSGFLTEPFELVPGDTLAREIGVASGPMRLPTIEVEGKNECRGKGEADAQGGILWEEVQKALTATVITAQDLAVPLHLRQFVREVGLNRQVQREWNVRGAVVRGHPFKTLRPEQLARLGFVQRDLDSASYAAPDAALLLSEEFIATHCFRAVPGGGSLAGLAFEPVAGRLVPEVRGTLWLDRLTSELRFLEYSYTGLTGLEKADLGGRLEFLRLTTGGWIVSYWHIRMPLLRVAQTGPARSELAGYRDQGGRAEVALSTAAVEDRAVVRGQLTDSTTGGGLAGAVVRVRGFRDSVLSDAAGRFRLAVTVSGDQVITATHPKLGLLRDSTSRALLLSVGDTTVADFAVPSTATFARRLCGAARSRSGVVGLVWGAGGMPAERLELQATTLGSAPARVRGARSGAKGLFALCDLPAGVPLSLSIQPGTTTRTEQRVNLARGEYRWVDLRAPPPI